METGPSFYEPREGLSACSAEEVPSFLSHFKTLSNGPAPGIEPATSLSAVKRSTDWANPATVKLNWLIWNSDIILCFTHYFCLSSWLLKYLQFYPPSFYKNGELLGSLALFKMAAILNFAEKFIYLYIYIEIKLMNIDIWVRAK